VDELCQDENDCEADEEGEVGLAPLATEGNAHEQLEHSGGLLDAGAASVEGAREGLGRRSGVGLLPELGGSENDAVHRFPDQRNGTAGAGDGPVGAAVAALVGDHGAG
jgi:hypothetical protein